MKVLTLGTCIFVCLVQPAIGDVYSLEFAKVTKVNDYGVMVFEKRYPARLWGIVVTVPETLRQLVVGKEIGCEFLETPSEIEMIDRAKCGSSEIRSVTGYQAEDLSQFLIERGAAFEFCAESRNHYGTCDGLTITYSHSENGESE